MTDHPTIVAGIDGTSSGDAALAFALVLARSLGTELLLVHACGPDEYEALESAGDVPAETVVVRDPVPARALQRLAAARRATAIVVGPSHRARLGLVLPGSTGQQLLAEADRAVAVVPRGWEDRPLRRVGVGYDGTAESRAALHSAVALTRALGGRLDVMRAFWSTQPRDLAAVAELETHVQAGLGAVVQELPEDVTAYARVLFNDPGRSLVERSRELDLMVLGSRGKRPPAAFLAGSVSSRLIRESACPVIVVPRGVILDLPAG